MKNFYFFDISTKEYTNFNIELLIGTSFYEIWAYKSEKFAKRFQKWT